jgi:hypothetical protein
MKTDSKFILEAQVTKQMHHFLLDFQDFWIRRMPVHLLRDVSESVPIHIIPFYGDFNLAKISGTMLVRSRPPKRRIGNQKNRGKSSTSDLFNQIEDDVYILESALAFYGDSSRSK